LTVELASSIEIKEVVPLRSVILIFHPSHPSSRTAIRREMP
jgi:hypothetical protein